jgi:hypothetical protein
LVTIGNPKITWSVPRWAFAPKLWQSLRRSILNRRSIVRICIGSLVACGAIVLALKLAFPALVVPNLLHLAMTVPLFLLVFALQFAVLAVFPPNVTLRSDRLQKSHGQSGLRIKSDQFVTTQIIVHRYDCVRLKIRYRQRARDRTLVIGVAPSVDLDQLVEILPIAPAIRDARSRSIAVQNCT